jgi:SAM-dependent methyltransferase
LSGQGDEAALAERRSGAPDHPRAPALLALLGVLKARRYRFTTPTPATQTRVLAREPDRAAGTLADLLGWNRPFRAGEVDAEVEDLLAAAGALAAGADGLRSRLRVSSLGDDLFLHSAYPTDGADAVFFGPDSYRFADLIRRTLDRAPLPPGASVIDIGAGSGVGGMVAARCAPDARVTLTDLNPAALALAGINAVAAGIAAERLEGETLAGFAGPIDLALANPPYLADPAGRTYRDGGDQHGAALSIDMAAAVLPRLAPGGRLVLYTGSAMVGGRDRLAAALAELARDAGVQLDYAEIDPDVFGEELDQPAYREVERIAAVSAIFTRPH